MSLLNSDKLALQAVLGTNVTAITKKTSRNTYQMGPDGAKIPTVEFITIEFSNGVHLKIGDVGEQYWSVHDTGRVTE